MAVREDGDPVALDVHEEDGSRAPCRPEATEACPERVEVDGASVDGVDGDRVAPAYGREDLRALRAEVLPLPADARRTIGPPGDADSLDLRDPAVDDEEVAGRGLAEQEPEDLPGLEGPHLGREGVEDPRGVAGREDARRRGLRRETAEACGPRWVDRHDHSMRRDRAAVHERHGSRDGDLVQEESRLEVVRAVDDHVRGTDEVLDGP